MTPPATTIRNKVTRELIKKHRAEFDRMYIEEATKSGLIYKYSTERVRITERQMKALSKTKKTKVR